MAFAAKAGMPFVIGAIDGTLINIKAPSIDEPAFVDRHGNHSLNCLAVCSADHRITYLNVDWAGAANDAFVFNNSPLQERLQVS